MADAFQAVELEALEAQASPSWLNVLHMIWRRRSLVALGVIASCILGALYYFRSTTIYQSSTLVLVVKKTPDALPVTSAESRSSYTDDYMSTHQTLIRSPVIVGDAVREASLASLPSFAGRGDPSGEIMAGLKVAREINSGSPTSVLNISFRCSGAEDSARVVEAIIESYQNFLRAKYEGGTNETAKLITQASDVLEKRLNAKQQEYDDFIVRQPAFWRGRNGLSAVQERLFTLEARRSALLLQEAEILGRIDSLEKALKEGRYSRAELLALLSQPRGHVSGSGNGNGNGHGHVEEVSFNMSFEERLMNLALQEKKLQEDYGQDHPQVRAVREQLDLMRKRMKPITEDAASGEVDLLDPVKIYMQTLKLELEHTRMASVSLTKLLQQEQRDTEKQRIYEKRDDAYRLEIFRSQQLFDAVTKRLDEVSILQNFAGGYQAEIIAPPMRGSKVHPRPLAVFAPALLLGLFLGFVLAYLAELSDQSFRTPEEIRRRLGLPVVGHIPFFVSPEEEDVPAGEEARPAAALRTFYDPKSLEAEGYRGVRTALFFQRREAGHSVIQVTSPDMGDGKSTLIANLAVAIAQAEKKVILIDADFRRPCLHKLFGLSPKQGLATVMSEEAELEDVIQQTPVPGLSVLPCGPIPPNPSELLTLPRFLEMLAYLRERYDYVLIDTPPLLAVTDPSVIVPHVDGVILTVRISKNARLHAARAKEILTTLGAHIFGVVVNGVGSNARGYSYREYHHYSKYHHDADASPSANGEEAPAANGTIVTVEKKRTASGRPSRKKAGFLSWFFDR
jgi:polysaccharide biosynthesis transport protein